MLGQGIQNVGIQSAQPMGEIAVQVQALRDVLDANARSLEALYARLSPVLSPEKLGGINAANSGGQDIRPSEAPLAESLADIVRNAEIQAKGINIILQRLAL